MQGILSPFPSASPSQDQSDHFGLWKWQRPIIPQHDQNDSQLFNPYVIASVAIDTSDLKKPMSKSIFQYHHFREDDTDDLRLTFQLSKSYQFGNKIPLEPGPLKETSMTMTNLKPPTLFHLPGVNAMPVRDVPTTPLN